MANDPKLSALTRSLILGVSMGTVGLTQVGCTPMPGATEAQAQEREVIKVRSGQEKQLCTAALKSGTAADASMFLRSYPKSNCIVPLLSALPGSALAALSPAAIANVPSSILRELPPRVLAQMPDIARARSVRVRPVVERNNDANY